MFTIESKKIIYKPSLPDWRQIKHIVATALFLVLVGCEMGPNSGFARRLFIEKNPDAQIVDIYVGEGDAVAVYYHIKYRLQNTEEMKEQVWQYIKNHEGKWEVTHIEQIK